MPHRRMPIVVLLLGLGAVWCAATARAHDEGEPAGPFLEAFRRAGADAVQAAGAWRTVADHHGDHHALGRLARFYLAVELLTRQNDPQAAEAQLQQIRAPQQDATATDAAVEKAARRLRAYLQMDRLATQLRQHYRREVRYPETLDALVQRKLAEPADLIDPFGQPFAYEARARASMPNVPRQVFTLRCASTGDAYRDGQTLLAPLTQPLERIRLEGSSTKWNQAYVSELRPDGTWSPSHAWKVGDAVGAYVLLAVHEGFVLVAADGLPRVIPTEPR